MTITPSPSEEASSESLEEHLRTLIVHAIPKLRPGDIKAGTPLFDLGIDSLDHAKILMTIEDFLGIEIDDEDINDLQSIDDLCNYCASRIRFPF
jgi:acyl carrier protein